MRVAKNGKIGGVITASRLVVATMFASITAHAATYYAKSAKTGSDTLLGNMTNIVVWCIDQGQTTLADPQPVIMANDGNTYVYTSIAGSKITQVTTFPAGTHVCLGADGVNIGTTAAAFGPNCTSDSQTIPDCTIYGLTWTPNYGYSGAFYGNYRLVKVDGLNIRFGASNLKDDVTYGTVLAGTFTGDSDVVIGATVYSVSSPKKGNGVAQVKFSGDFSGYRGRFETIAFTNDKMTTGHLTVWFTSATSMGDPTSEMDNALTLRHRSYLRIDEAVTQSATRGITLDLSAGQFAALTAGSKVRWTLRTPVHGGTTGTLKKVGVGTVVFASAMEATDILVEEGALVLSNGVSFTEGTTITVANGATCTNLVQGIPNLTVVAEEGGTYVCPLDVVPYDGTAATPLDCTSFTAADRVALTKPIPIALSQAFTIPFTETNRLAVATFSAAAGFVAGDFADTTPKSYQRLPTTWFETETAAGVTTLYLVARPVMQYSTGNNLFTAANWTDGKNPHMGADYYSTLSGGKLRTGTGSNVQSFDFLGETFSFNNFISDYAVDFYARELRLHNGSEVRMMNASTSSGYTKSYRRRNIRGIYVIEDSATATAPASIRIGSLSEKPDLGVTLTGGGTLRVIGEHVNVADENVLTDPYYYIQSGVYPTYINFDAGSFSGRLDFVTERSTRYINAFVTNGLAFGGPLATYTSNAVRLTNVTDTVSITAMNDITVDAANRGWYVAAAKFGASNDVTFTFSPPTLTLTTSLRKTGGGTLAMGCPTIGAGSALYVDEGYVKALSADCCTNLELAVSSGAGIMVDAAPADPEVAAKGLIAKSILPAEEGGEIAVALDVSGGKPAANEVAVAICTVPAEQADLSDVLSVKGVPGFMATFSKDAETYAEEGLVTYRALWRRLGTRIIIQ